MEKENSQVMRGLKLSVEMISNIHQSLAGDKQEMKVHFEKFKLMVNNSICQVVGSKNIRLPKRVAKSLSELRNSNAMHEEHEELIRQWTKTIEGTMKTEQSKPLDCRHSLGVIEYWRLRSSVLNMLHQELSKPDVARVSELLAEFNHEASNSGSSAVEEFELRKKELGKLNAEAKDNVKFLSTLERQFKNLQSDDLGSIEQCLPSLLNGLKLVFIISRHFKSEDRISSLLAIISDEICDKVERLVSFEKLFRQEEGVSSEKQLDRAINLIQQGRSVLAKWKLLFENTKEKLEKEGGERWEFDQKPIKDRPEHMIIILDHFQNVALKLKKYFAFLGPKLKAVVTGNSQQIDELILKVKDITKEFEKVGINIYKKSNRTELDKIIKQYEKDVNLIQKKTESLIETTFKDLRSSESAFELLKDFKNLENLEHIREKLSQKYSNVLSTYRKELNENQALFEAQKNQPMFGKDKPPVTAAISWKRAILYRIKRPILKFIKDPKDWEEEELKKAKEEYKTFAKKLDAFEDELLNAWGENVDMKATICLKKRILEKTASGRFVVGFRDDFKELIAEARNLDKMGFALHSTILNITLQEKEYYKCVDRLRKVLGEYESEVSNLSDVERDLLSVQVKQLGNTLEQNAESFNLHSLGISDFIRGFREDLKKFRELRNKIDEKKRMIEDIVGQIANAELISKDTLRVFFEQQIAARDFMSLTRFSSLISEDVETTAKALVEKFSKIGDTMLPQIEFVVTGKQSRKCGKMRAYYFYWERRVYNALIQMISRTLLTFKALINRRGSRPTPLFRVSTEFQYQKVITIPHINEIRVTVNNLVKKIKDVAGGFPRWKEGTCQALDISDENLKSRDLSRMTYLKDVNDNGVIKLISMELGELKKMTFVRLEKYKSVWELKKENKEDRDPYENFKRIIWNQKNKFKIEKMIEKNPSITNFEFFIEYFHSFLSRFDKERQQTDAGFIRVDFSNVKNAFIAQCEDCLDRISGSLLKIAAKEAEDIKAQIEEYDQNIDRNAQSLAELKNNLNVIREIGDRTMDIELAIEELAEKFRILWKFGLKKVDANPEIVESLKTSWQNLLSKANCIKEGLKDKTKQFSARTKEEVASLKVEIKDLHNRFKAEGPDAEGISLDEGYQRLLGFQKERNVINARKTDLVASEKLFSPEVSSFPLLVEVEEKLSELDSLFEFFKKVRGVVNSWERVLWSKLDFVSFESDKKMLTSQTRKIEKKAPNKRIFKKIKKEIDDFTDTFPIIQKLKMNSDFKEDHWEKLMQEIGASVENVNFKMITLKQVFDLRLQNQNDKVDEVVSMASQEAQNQKIIHAIETFWKNASFKCCDYKKGEEKRGTVLKVDEEILQTLNDHLVELQNMESSKYAFTLKGVIREWVGNLNRVQDTVDVWLDVQRKWMHLEGIFIGNEDIRQRLAQQTKKFEGFHKSFRKLNEQVAKNPNVFVNCVTIESTLSQLNLLKGNFDNSQKSLTEYLSSKKECFPRFYFISEEDLLGILGSSDLAAVEPHLTKLFVSCKQFLTSRSGAIKGMLSEEGETFEFQDIIKPEGAVEVWMNKVEQEMKQSLHKKMKEGIFYFSKMERQKWLMECLGMITIGTSQVWWTWRVEDVFSRVKLGNKYAMKEEAKAQTKDLNKLITLVRSNLEDQPNGKHLRKKVNTLIIINVHARDIVERFVRDSVLDAKEFEWESQLRFYWVNSSNDLEIRQCTGKFVYGYEYQGLNGRLVITALTDRCVMTLTTALTFKLGGSPAGPAGTGKTETCKDLAKSLGRRCIVTNCGENFDSFSMGNVFSGLCQTGFWGCFDEFNRIFPEVMSVVSSQIKSIQLSLLQNKKTVKLLGKEISLRPTIGYFITMNPGYEGRSELPDNLKVMFRPVTMVVPEKGLICENILMSEGFMEARALAKKMNVLYKLSEEQLSVQAHYDFGLRALKSVLMMAGQLKRDCPLLSEEKVLMRAMRDMNMPKFVAGDVELFLGLINDLFPNMNLEGESNLELRKKINEALSSKNYELIKEQEEKVIQLYETMNTRHTTMIVGPSGAGKTTILESLAKALETPEERAVKIFPLNPKAQDLVEMYGVMDPQTRDWTDGVLSHIFKRANVNSKLNRKVKEEIRWILFDGDVDAKWIENMNSVMDENKILTLSNGDRIGLRGNCKLLFEVYNLGYASLATISRSGMVYVDSATLGPAPYFNRWAKDYTEHMDEEEKPIRDLLMELYEKYVPELTEFVFKEKIPGKDNSDVPELSLALTPLNVVSQLCKLIDSLLDEHRHVVDSTAVESFFVFGLAWSFGGCLTALDRKRVDQIIKEYCSVRVSSSSLFDIYYDMQEKSFIKWENDQLKEYQPGKGVPFSRLLVSTADTVRHSYLIRKLMAKNFPTLVVGDLGTGKTVTIQNCLRSLDAEKNALLNLNFSSRTSSLEVQTSIENMTDRRRQGLYGPKGGKRLVVFIDEMHMPHKDKYETQQPIALLRFLIDKGKMYERGGNLELKTFKDITFIGALLPPGGGYHSLNPRFLALFNVFEVEFPSHRNIQRIYDSLLLHHLKDFSTELKEIGMQITLATIGVYQQVKTRLPRTPLKFHYIFNLRDMSRVMQGMLRANQNHFSKAEDLLFLWQNEVHRVFCDRLSSIEDSTLVKEIILPAVAAEHFEKELLETLTKKKGLIVDFMLAEPLEEEYSDPRILRVVPDWKEVQAKCEDMLEKFNEEFPERKMDLVLFKDAVMHLARIMRIIGFPGGHGLLVGFGGSGKQSLIKLAGFIRGLTPFQIRLKRNYKEVNFREDLLEMFRMLTQGQEILFLLSDSHILEEGFLELINGILTVGVVNSLFEDTDKMEIVNNLRDKSKKAGAGETSDEVWGYFSDVIKKQLHILMSMSPAGDTLRRRCQEFPGLINASTVDWFFEWPADALRGVGDYVMIDEGLKSKSSLVEHCVFVYGNIVERSKDYMEQKRRPNYATAKTYLDFLKTFNQLMAINKKRTTERVQGYEKGLDKLAESGENIAELQVEIADEKTKVEKEKIEVEELLKEIAIKSENVTEKRQFASEKKAQLAVENKEIREKQNETERILAEKLPALKVAREKVSQIKKTELDFIKSMANPNELIRSTVACLQILKINSNADESTGWIGAKAMLSDMNLVNTLLNYSRDNSKIQKVTSRQIKALNEKLKKINQELTQKNKKMTDVSTACAKLLAWVDAVKLLYDTNLIVKPLEDTVAKLTHKKNIKEKELQDTVDFLAVLSQELEELNERKKSKQEVLEELTARVEAMEAKLSSAKKLIEDLAEEQVRWSRDKNELKKRQVYLEGECMLAAGFMSYFGPFDQEFRNLLLEQHKRDLIQRDIPVGEDFRVLDLLTSEVETAEWNSQGLPADELSLQNGVLTLQKTRYPYCIDPQLQAVKWIKKREGKDLRVVVPSDEGRFLQTIEQSVKFGKAMLIENIGEEIDPLLDPVLLKNFVLKAGRPMLLLGSEEIEFNKSFRMYMTCKLNNPSLTPETMGKTNVINYSVTFSGLKEQLLNEVVGFEQEEKERLRKKLVLDMSENKKLLKRLEDKLLVSLGESETSILNNVKLIETLDETKKKSTLIDKALKEGAVTRQTIELARLNYVDIARRGAILFFCMQKLSAISEMYEYSLSSYLEVFKRALKEAEPDNILNTRKNNIIETLTLNVYDYVLLGLFEKHKLMFSFLMTVMIMEESGKFDNSLSHLYDFFLKGNTDLEDPSNAGKPKWISNRGWKDLHRLRTLTPLFEHFSQSLVENEMEWRQWAESQSPEDTLLPESFLSKAHTLLAIKEEEITEASEANTRNDQGNSSGYVGKNKKMFDDSERPTRERSSPEEPFGESGFLASPDQSVHQMQQSALSQEMTLSKDENQNEENQNRSLKFELLMILKILRPDRVINGIKHFILDFFKPNEHFIQSPTTNLCKVLSQSSEISPIVFILSPGADPISDVQILADSQGFSGNKFKYLSLGQNMEQEAEELISNSAQRGNWVMLQNCNLLPGWLPRLETILEGLEAPHPDFRLWLTTKPSKAFPIGILQTAMKIVTEPPDGLRQNINALTAKLTDESLKQCEHSNFNGLSYVLMFFHAILLDRKKFGKIGFNVEYDFNESDFRISNKLLSLYLNKSLNNQEEELPWGSLKYLIGEAMYGGRVTDEFDRRVLNTYLDEFMGDFLFDKNNEFLFAQTNHFKYKLPGFENVEQLVAKNEQLPIFDEPGIFGLNPNAEITYFSNSAKELWANLIKMTSVGGGSTSIATVSDQISKVIAEIQEKLPVPLDLKKLRAEAPKPTSSTYVVLLQEVERFNVLLEVMSQSLKDLTRALSGEIAMNAEIEKFAGNILNGFLPAKWGALSPQTNKNLGSWMAHCKLRHQQYCTWSTKGEPKVMWLSGLHIPESYLIAVIQVCCRKKKWPLDKVKLRTRITKYTDERQVTSRLKFGCYVKGLFIEGAAWDHDKGCVTRQGPGQLIAELPFMEIVPVERRKLKNKNNIKVPVYVTQSRGNERGEGLVFEADLTSFEHESHWILQGLAIVLNKD